MFSQDEEKQWTLLYSFTKPLSLDDCFASMTFEGSVAQRTNLSVSPPCSAAYILARNQKDPLINKNRDTQEK